MNNCIACGKPIADAWVEGIFHSADPSSRLNGIRFVVDNTCFSMSFPDPTVTLPPRVSDPEMELTEKDAAA